MLKGVCVSGEKPMTREDTLVLRFVTKRLCYAVKLDINGSYPIS